MDNFFLLLTIRENPLGQILLSVRATEEKKDK
jgi:hypothetical protein